MFATTIGTKFALPYANVFMSGPEKTYELLLHISHLFGLDILMIFFVLGQRGKNRYYNYFST